VRLKKTHAFIYLSLLLILFLFHLVNNYIVLYYDETLYVYDLYDYFDMSIFARRVILSILSDIKSNIVRLPELLAIHQYRPPLFMIVSGIFLSFFQNPTIDLAVMSNMIFMLILLFSIYKIGKHLCNQNVGILSAFIVTMFPGIFGFSRVLMVEFALTAIVALTFVMLLLSRNFTNRKYSVLLGFTFAMGMLMKVTYPVFVIGPFLYTFFSFFRNVQSDKKIRHTAISNLIISICIAGLLSSIWYLSSSELALASPRHWKIPASSFTMPGLWT